MENNNQPQNPLKPIDGHFLKFFIVFILILIIVLGGYFIYETYLSSNARSARETQKNYQKYLDWQKNYESAMTADTYGGKTPQETLNLFIEALKKEDVELASKYFLLNEEGGTDQKWIDLINKLKNENNMVRFAGDMGKYDNKFSFSDSIYIFSYNNEDGSVGLQLKMTFNQFSNVWKIESL